jgi:hypothetical protein
VHKRVISAVKRIKFVRYRMSYVILRGHWCHIIVLKVYDTRGDKTDCTKGSFYEEQKQLIPKVPHEDAVRRFQCQSREIRYFKTINWE